MWDLGKGVEGKCIEESVYKFVEMLQSLLYTLTLIIPGLQLGLLNHSSPITFHFYNGRRKR